MIFYFYIKIFGLIMQYIKVHWMRRHIYYSTLLSTSVYFFLYTDIFAKYLALERYYRGLILLVSFIFHCLDLKIYDQEATQDALRTRLTFYGYKYPLEQKIAAFINAHQYNMHRIIGSIVLTYDLILNDFIITHVYSILPYVFVYEIWSKISLFYTNINSMKDAEVRAILYTDPSEWIEIPFSEGKEFYVGNNEITLEFVRHLLKTYLFKGLIDPEFGVKEPMSPLTYIIAYMHRFRLYMIEPRSHPNYIIIFLFLILLDDIITVS